MGRAVPGLVALVARGEEVHVEAVGSLAIGGPPVDRSTLFRIASTTKPITAAATLALVREGLVELDEPVDRLLPELAGRRVLRRMDGPLDDTVPAVGPVTVRGLLDFTFGFGMAAEMFLAREPWPVVAACERAGLATLGPPHPDGLATLGPPHPDGLATLGPPHPNGVVDPETWIAGFGALPLLAQPGERWLYNTGAQVLGVLCARAAGLPFDEVLRTRIFAPLGMRDTGFHAAEARRLATAYRPTADGLVVWDRPDGQWSRPPAFPDGAAGLVSTADDLSAFARMLLRGGEPVLAADQVREMGRDRLSAAQRESRAAFLGGRGWGLGSSVVREGAGRRSVADGCLVHPLPGAPAAWCTRGLVHSASWCARFLMHPHRDLAVIVLTQRMFETSQPPAVHAELQAAALAASE